MPTQISLGEAIDLENWLRIYRAAVKAGDELLAEAMRKRIEKFGIRIASDSWEAKAK